MGNYSNMNRKQFKNFKFLIKSFRYYLKNIIGLSSITINNYCSNVECFFNTEYKKNEINLNYLSPKKIIQLFLKFSKKNSCHRTQSITFSLRSFFRYLKQAHLIKEDLADIIPCISNKKRNLTSDTLSFEQTELILTNCIRTNPSGKRDYAILMLMIKLGLRSCEVCNLELNDINWEIGEISIRGKGSEENFPMFEEVGKALVDYLKNARPNCKCKKVFIRLKRPFKGITTSAIRHITSSAFNRCNFTPSRRGAHLLRHSFAVQLLGEGASLEEVSLLLRHEDIETTAIYARVNFNKLRAIVQPWPENIKMEEYYD